MKHLVKLHIDLPNHWMFKGESIWAISLGDDLYEINNVPFCAYGLNCGDVVRATADAPDLKPEVREVVRPSGHRTLRVLFEGVQTSDYQDPLIKALQSMEVHVERQRTSDLPRHSARGRLPGGV